jgi:hypothetical protein
VHRRIIELDGVAAAVAIVMDSESANAAGRVRDTWLGAAGSDGRSDHGLLGQLTRDDGGRWLAPSPIRWTAQRRVSFGADSRRGERLAGARSASVGTVNMGLRDAAKARRRSRARR